MKLEAPSAMSTDGVSKATRESVRVLRTWLSHNLGFENDHDLEVRRAASEWFIGCCGAIVPNTEVQWRACFERLSQDVNGVLQEMSGRVSAIASMALEDRSVILSDLASRLKRDWPSHEFEKRVSDSAVRLGGAVNAKALCEVRISAWRQFLLALPSDADIELEVERLIDGEVAQHLQSRPPIGAGELMRELQLEPGPTVRRAMELAQRQVEEGVRDRVRIIEAVRAGLLG
jgi:hypothetical protein